MYSNQPRYEWPHHKGAARYHTPEQISNPEKRGYMPSGLAFSTDVHHLNNSKDSNQATINNMGMERGRKQKERDNQSSGKATAKINRKTASAASTCRRGDEDPYDRDSDTEHHCYLDSLMLVHGVQPLPLSTVTISSRPA